jgi:cytochrome c oxidase cbb3-type subunit 3
MLKIPIAAAAAALVVSTLAAQAPPAQTPPPQRGRGGDSFPAQQRPPGDPAVIARGKALYGVNCTFCHGPDLRGGQLNGPNLLRSPVVLSDQNGELIIPIVRRLRSRTRT